MPKGGTAIDSPPESKTGVGLRVLSTFSAERYGVLKFESVAKPPATTQPMWDESTWTAGTGLNIGRLDASRMSTWLPLKNDEAAGQDEPAGGFETQSTSEPK